MSERKQGCTPSTWEYRVSISSDDFMKFLAAWALVHESADEGWKSAVVRGRDQAPGRMSEGPEAFVDGLSAMIAEEKDRLKEALASGDVEAPGTGADLGTRLDELRFEVNELRGLIESLQASIDALTRPSSRPE